MTYIVHPNGQEAMYLRGQDHFFISVADIERGMQGTPSAEVLRIERAMNALTPSPTP